VVVKGTGIELDGKIAVVTGGASGIGRAIVDELVARGATVIVGDLDAPDALTQVRPGVSAVRCDISRESDLDVLIQAAEDAGGIDILVNCAGISMKEPIGALTRAAWDKVITTNLTGTAFATSKAVARMTPRRSGAIVNIASVAGFNTLGPQNAAYVATKGAIIALTKALVYELAPLGIRINAVAPGLVNTPILDSLPEEWRRTRVSRVPAGYIAKPGEIAPVVTFLASDAASYINGQTIIVDGGATSVTFIAEG
jgi:3-oxoacyl-[acyl-carrier protein] reductase